MVPFLQLDLYQRPQEDKNKDRRRRCDPQGRWKHVWNLPGKNSISGNGVLGSFENAKKFGNIYLYPKKSCLQKLRDSLHICFVKNVWRICAILAMKNINQKYNLQIFMHFFHLCFGKMKYGKGDGSKRRRAWVFGMKCCDRRWKKSAKPAMSRELWEPFCFRFLVCEFPSISCPMLRENPPPRTDFQCSSQSEIGQQLFLTSSVWPYFS